MTSIWWYRIACIALCLATLPMFMARDGARGGLRAWLSLTVSGLLIYGPTRAADVWLGDVAGWCVLLFACAAWFVGRTPLGHLNFLVLQWLGLRLTAGWDAHTWAPDVGRWWSRHAPDPRAPVRWSLLRWVWPLTGWWSPYVRIGRRPRGVRSWLAGEPGPIGRERP